MGGLFKPWRIVGASITESELSDSISNILHHFMVAHSQSQNNASLKNTCPLVYNLIREYLKATSNALFFRTKSGVFA